MDICLRDAITHERAMQSLTNEPLLCSKSSWLCRCTALMTVTVLLASVFVQSAHAHAPFAVAGVWFGLVGTGFTSQSSYYYACAQCVGDVVFLHHQRTVWTAVAEPRLRSGALQAEYMCSRLCLCSCGQHVPKWSRPCCCKVV